MSPLEARIAGQAPPPNQVQADLGLFSNRLGAMPPAFWNSRPVAGIGSRAAFVGRGQAYLSAVGRLAGQFPVLGGALSGAYRSLGNFQESSGFPSFADPRGAMLSYQNSGLFLTQLANQNPNDPGVRGQLVILGGRISALGGSIPLWFSVPVGGAMQNEPRGIPDNFGAPMTKEPESTIESPNVDVRTITEAERPLHDAAMEKFLNASSSVQAASSALSSVRQSVNRHGWSLAASSEKSLIRMRLTLEEAKRLMEQKNFDSSMKMLDIADGEARKVLKSLGQ